MIVVADASPLRYLILIEHTHVLPALYGRVIVPPAVITELTRERTPNLVRTWVVERPDWLHVQAPTQVIAPVRADLGQGEREAIRLAVEMSADALLVDDRDARHEAERLGVPVLGTLRVLADASQHGFADLAIAFARLAEQNPTWGYTRCTISGVASSMRGRPPPGRRTATTSSAATPARSSSRPARIVVRESPVARPTIAIPPSPTPLPPRLPPAASRAHPSPGEARRTSRVSCALPSRQQIT